MRFRHAIWPVLTAFVFFFMAISSSVFSSNLGQPLKNVERVIPKNPKKALQYTDRYALLNKLQVGESLTEEDKAYLERLKVRNAKGKSLEDVEKDILKLHREKKEKSRKWLRPR